MPSCSKAAHASSNTCCLLPDMISLAPCRPAMHVKVISARPRLALEHAARFEVRRVHTKLACNLESYARRTTSDEGNLQGSQVVFQTLCQAEIAATLFTAGVFEPCHSASLNEREKVPRQPCSSQPAVSRGVEVAPDTGLATTATHLESSILRTGPERSTSVMAT